MRIFIGWIMMAGLAAGLLFADLSQAAGSDYCAKPIPTQQGPVSGAADPEQAVCAYKGIPYAAPPVGARRWRAPADAPTRSEALAALEFGPKCLQLGDAIRLGINSVAAGSSEDCLYLNIWSPKKSGLFPVMVWIHGGDLMQGSGSLEMYRGERLAAEREVVVVSINYRLGPFGYLYLPGLAEEDLQHRAGNYGLLDQVKALKWVSDNIAGFGGDSKRATIFGESAGGWSVCSLLASPLAAGLFQRAIIMSGGCECFKTKAEGEVYGLEFASRLGCREPGAVACLRAKPGAEVLKALGRDWQKIMTHFFPHLDGIALKESPLVALQSGRYNRVPLMVGSTRDEFKLFASELPGGRRLPQARLMPAAKSYMRADLGPELFELYPPEAFRVPVDALIAAVGDAYLGCPNYRAARASSVYQPSTFYYRFDFNRHLFPNRIGASHGMDLPFVFDSADRPPLSYLYTKGQILAARPLTETMMSYWTNFAATGDPNGAQLPAWPAHSGAGQERILLDLPATTAPADLAAKCEYWERQPIVVH